ncbi:MULTISPECIES: hypothetical protein [unclassified Arthrobacter]|uniref:hypothetical protein n=1 Tax=unclassified Arthrobacter TaxID=235627 RepID=UPI0006FDBD38|nr:hypothetical protein [Arthrobacter sp. Leaf234]KQO03353.1 hypothetical protein ASF21_03375 [Arthrobacter sp. Leaf234]
MRPTPRQDTTRPDPVHLHHEHAWATESVHPTSEGRVHYVRCGTCDVRRVDLQPTGTLPPIALSCPIGSSR